MLHGLPDFSTWKVEILLKINQICLEAWGHKQFSVVLPGHGTQAE